MKNAFFLIVGLGLILGSFYLFLQNPAPRHLQNTGTILLGDTMILVDIASTSETRSQGLSGRESLAEGEGMLFNFETPSTYGFWMKEMKFAIDIIWINEDMQVVGVERDVEPETFPKVFYPSEPIKHVVEVPAGFSLQNNIDIGTRLNLEN